MYGQLTKKHRQICAIRALIERSALLERNVQVLLAAQQNQIHEIYALRYSNLYRMRAKLRDDVEQLWKDVKNDIQSRLPCLRW